MVGSYNRMKIPHSRPRRTTGVKGSKRGPLGRRKRELVVGSIKQGFSQGKSLWSVAEEALSLRGAFGGEGFSGREASSVCGGFAEAITVAVHLQDVDLVGEPVQQGAGEPLGAEDLGPFVEGQVAGDQNRCP